ncbi:MAG: haloacid dehalogenase-like hydrolase [Bdellovibrionota bacterium]
MSKFNYNMFFDANDSLFNFEVKYSFLEYFLLETLPVESYARRAYDKYIDKMNKNILNGASPCYLSKEYFKNFSGMPVKLMFEIANSWYYKSKLDYKEDFFNQKVLFEIKMHKRSNAQIVILSSLFSPCLEVLKEEIFLDAMICSELEVINGYYTGNIICDPLVTEGKSEAIKNFLLKQDSNIIDQKDDFSTSNEVNNYFCDISYDYSDDIINYFSSERFKSLYRN